MRLRVSGSRVIGFGGSMGVSDRVHESIGEEVHRMFWA